MARSAVQPGGIVPGSRPSADVAPHLDSGRVLREVGTLDRRSPPLGRQRFGTVHRSAPAARRRVRDRSRGRLGREVLVDGAVDVSLVDEDEWVLDLGECVAFTPFDEASPTNVSMFVPVVRCTFMHLGLYPDTPICVTAIGDATAPSWQDCNGDTVAGGVWPSELGPYAEGCGIINPTVMCPVDTETQSWGTVKARFGG